MTKENAQRDIKERGLDMLVYAHISINTGRVAKRVKDTERKVPHNGEENLKVRV